jgi:hypothetical protein
VRDDLPRGVLAVNILHAAGESAAGRVDCRTNGVVLSAKNEIELKVFAERCEAKGLRVTPIQETEGPFEGQLMALGIHPDDGREARRWLSSVPLLRERP